jgi:hypothetical protein
VKPQDDYVIDCDSCTGGYNGLRICEKCLGAGRLWVSTENDMRNARRWNWIIAILGFIGAAVLGWIIVWGLR